MKSTMRIMALLLCAAMVFALGACSQQESAPQPAEEAAGSEQAGVTALAGTESAGGAGLVYLAEGLPLPDGAEAVSLTEVVGSTAYVVGYSFQTEGTVDVICALDLGDGGRTLRTYALPEELSGVRDISPDGDGGLWIMANLGENAGEKTGFYHYGKDGAVDGQFTLTGLSSSVMWFLADGERDCLYAFEMDTLHVLDREGNELFKLTGTSLYHPCFTADGRLAVCDSVDGNAIIKLLDFDGQQWGESITPEISYRKMFSGSVYDLYCSDGETLYGLNLDTREYIPLFSWLEAGLGNDVFEVAALSNARFFVAADSGLYIVSPSDGDPRKTLTMAVFEEYEIAAQEALEFNSSQSDYKLVIKNYGAYNTDGSYAGAVSQLNLDIAAGDIPDIYDLKGMPVSQYIELGLLEDIYPYIDADPDMAREDFIPSLLSAMETDGGLYCLMPHVGVMSLWADPAALDGDTSLSLDGMLALADGSDPFGGDLTRYDFVQSVLAGDNSPFVDWAKGECYFDSAAFMTLLEFVKLLPESLQEIDMAHPELYVPNTEPRKLVYFLAMDAGSVIYISGKLDCLDGGEGCAAAVGLPGTEGASYLLYPTRHIWGMSAFSENKDGVWQFMRSYLLEEYQRTNAIPLRRTAWEEVADEYDAWIAEGGRFGTIVQGEEVSLQVTDRTYFETVENLVDSATGIYEENPALMEIIWSEAQGYFAGDKTAEKAAQNIQSRVSIYMAEQG